MNFLAHLTLPSQSPPVLTGNYMADSFKGRVEKFPDQEMRKGIVLHRAIDDFADQHPISKELVTALRPSQGKFAAVVLDILYDHLLAQRFDDYHHQPLRNSADHIYTVLHREQSRFEGHAKQFFPHMVENDLLFNYQKPSVIQQVFRGMSRRTRFPNQMNTAWEAFEENRYLFEAKFNDYYEDFLNHFDPLPL